ncbi:hypothetical protein BT96DRAFT_991889 [Gymnopus androsaceus JB14]|uniref:Uncharacterized protein n=1 Tax=Gymnopus androsaceus JB14 TaxID=1447944 RepID=A0A6A4HX04_9AGAR|nr:hypothetical protein BT96DRAFT_991889 [Gymnopus androsaceus JB14]
MRLLRYAVATAAITVVFCSATDSFSSLVSRALPSSCPRSGSSGTTVSAFITVSASAPPPHSATDPQYAAQDSFSSPVANLHANFHSSPCSSFPSGDDKPDLSLGPRTKKRRRMSSDSASKPPSSVVSFSSFADGGYSTTSPTISRRSISGLASELPLSNGFNNANNNNDGFNTFRGSATNALWHPPMIYLHPAMMHHDDDALFSTYLHPPMSLPSDDSSASSSGASGAGNSNANGNQSEGGNESLSGCSGNHYHVAQEYG